MQRQLTDAFLRSVKPPAAGRIEISDVRCAGLVFRITDKGAKSWSYRFRASGRLSRATIGQYPTVGLTDARAAADAMRREVATGGNPVRRRRGDRSPDKTFGALAKRYLAEHAERFKRSHRADERNLHKHILPHWHNRPYTEIKRGDVIELVEGIILAGKGTLANRVQSLVSTIFTFAMDADLVDANPCHRLRKRGTERVGHRVLSDDEIRLFWPGIVAAKRGQLTGRALQLALLTAARVGELAGMARSELEHIGDPTKAAWIIPGSRTKNKRDHLVPLSPAARAIVLELLEMIGPKAEHLFPTRARRRIGPIRGNSLTQAMDYFSERLPKDEEGARAWRVDPPTPHALRRTVETRLAKLRIPKETRDRVLNHIPGDVGSKHYNKHDYADEKREALSRWALEVNAILDGSIPVVVSITAARERVR
jgi:integrase